MNDRTEKEPPKVAIESEKSERASREGCGRRIMAAVVSTAEAWYGQIRVRERGGRGGRRDEMRAISGQRKEEGEERREERRSAGKADGEREEYMAGWGMKSESDSRIKKEQDDKMERRTKS